MDTKNSGKYIEGIGGVFFRSKNPGAIKDWYKSVFDLPTDDHGVTFHHKTLDANSATQQWSVFSAESEYFPTTQHVMINYRVYNINEFLEHLRSHGVTVVKDAEEFVYENVSFGWFAHIVDGDGNVVELWQPAKGM
jgi:D-3-phosphoglycerate dehydrogenase / 2-oxoglutarate reductase